ncbi:MULTISPECIES: hypothetical protein [unclassified Caulobacter]|uniref:hypothetical protein n=1 Tax=Caulobacter sp. 3R27C2-B TaxID=2502219 RepID=UPI001E57C683|nr:MULTISPECIES: hypothetical protein [unclassified Caulobacter]
MGYARFTHPELLGVRAGDGVREIGGEQFCRRAPERLFGVDAEGRLGRAVPEHISARIRSGDRQG